MDVIRPSRRDDEAHDIDKAIVDDIGRAITGPAGRGAARKKGAKKEGMREKGKMEIRRQMAAVAALANKYSGRSGRGWP